MFGETVIADTIFGIILGEGFDWSKDKIKKVIQNKKDKNSQESYHTKMYQAVIIALDDISYGRYINNQDRLYEAAEELVKGWSSSGVLNADIIRKSLRLILDQVDNDKINGFLEFLCEGICLDEDLYIRYIISNSTAVAEGIQEIKSGTKVIHKKIDNLKEDIRGISDKIEKGKENQAPPKTISLTEKFTNNKKQEYIDKWNGRLFLHQGDDDKPLTLANTFIMPDYAFLNSIPLTKEEISKNDDLNNLLFNFINFTNRKILIITGVPGIGKTSIVSYLANKFDESNQLLVLRFRDWEEEDFEKGLLKAICNTFECRKIDLNDKLILLDGFDEIKSLHNRNKILGNFFNEINDLKKTKVIITSRPNYLEGVSFSYIIELKPFNNSQIRMFYNNLVDIKINEGILFNNVDILGIPVILYMAIVSGIDINNVKISKQELYSRIFAFDDGIFDRFSVNDNLGYDYGAHVMRDRANKEIFLEFLQEIAFAMFEKNDFKLNNNEYKIPTLEFQQRKVKIMDFPVRNLFEKGNYIEFVHKSIYEYFVAEKIFNEIREAFENEDKVLLAGRLGGLLSSNKLSKEVIQFLDYKMNNDNKIKNDYNFFKDTFDKMIGVGMLYFTNNSFENIIYYESIVFSNVMEIIHIWNEKYFDFNNVKYQFIKYIRLVTNYNNNINLSKVYLCNNDEWRSDNYFTKYKMLSEKDSLNTITENKLSYHAINTLMWSIGNSIIKQFEKANLSGINFRGASLAGLNLVEANVEHTNLEEATLI